MSRTSMRMDGYARCSILRSCQQKDAMEGCFEAARARPACGFARAGGRAARGDCRLEMHGTYGAGRPRENVETEPKLFTHEESRSRRIRADYGGQEVLPARRHR